MFFSVVRFFTYWLMRVTGFLREFLFDTSKHYLINQDGRHKLAKYFEDTINEKGLTGIYQIAFETQTSPFTLWQIRKGAITTHRLRSMGVFIERYQNGEELIGSCFKLRILPLPSAIIRNRERVLTAARNIDCGFVIGYMIPSLPSSLAQWIASYFIPDKESVNIVLQKISSKTIKAILKSLFLYSSIENTIHFVKTSMIVEEIISDVEDGLLPARYLNHINQSRDTFIYKARLKSSKIDEVMGQRELMHAIEEFACEVREELGIENEDSYTRFFNCEEILSHAEKFPNVMMKPYDDSNRNISKRINLEVHLRGDMGRYLGGISTSSKGESKVIVVLNENFHPYRLVFWLVHEISHYLLNHPGSYSINPWEFYKLRNNAEIGRFETEAYLLTSTLLVPREKLKASLEPFERCGKRTYERLAQKWDIDPYQMGTLLFRDYREGLVDEDGFEKYRDSYYKYYKNGEFPQVNN